MLSRTARLIRSRSVEEILCAMSIPCVTGFQWVFRTVQHPSKHARNRRQFCTLVHCGRRIDACLQRSQGLRCPTEVFPVAPVCIEDSCRTSGRFASEGHGEPSSVPGGCIKAKRLFRLSRVVPSSPCCLAGGTECRRPERRPHNASSVVPCGLKYWRAVRSFGGGARGTRLLACARVPCVALFAWWPGHSPMGQSANLRVNS